MATTKRTSVDLEKSMQELEQVVEQLEGGDLSLDKSLKQFEKGVKLSRDCQAALTKAEQKVQVLMKSELQDLDSDELQSS